MNSLNNSVNNNNSVKNKNNIINKLKNSNEINSEEENYIINTANAAEKLQSKGTLLKETDVTLTQPYLLNDKLREYQLIGLNWLLALNDNKIIGILGLGKTNQTIALFA